MVCQVEYAPRAVKDLQSLEITIARRIVKKINTYRDTGNPLKFAKQLKGDLGGAYRFRVGDYRVVFDIDQRDRMVILFVLRIGH
ncbi:MAG: type II toxin-antitoxin system RelE/ParE family toxin [Patescibacteria group bacterium]